MDGGPLGMRCIGYRQGYHDGQAIAITLQALDSAKIEIWLFRSSCVSPIEQIANSISVPYLYLFSAQSQFYTLCFIAILCGQTLAQCLCSYK